MLWGISQIASDYDYAIQISTGQDEQHRLENMKQMILGKRVDGLIFLYSKQDDPLVDFAVRNNFPIFIGGSGHDELHGGAGDDRLAAGSDGSWLDGGAGDDTFAGGAGDDRLTDESGNDTYHLSTSNE